MICIKNIICFGILSFIIAFKISAQTELPRIVPASPEAKGMAKYGDIPISEYTGVPDISIPLYTIKIGELTLPITLSYHATGIEVSQEATWVGLGWNLIAGGNISYIPVGGDDHSDSRPSKDEFISLLNYMGTVYPMMKNEDWYVGWDCVPEKSTPQIVTESMIRALINGLEEQDVYSANFLNYSFKFIENPKVDNSFIFVGQKNKCKIEGSFGSGFIITGEDGIRYYFSATESGFVPNKIAWFLTKIVSPTGDEIILKYKQATTKKLPPLSESYTIVVNGFNDIGIGDNIPQRNVSQILPQPRNLYLETIETKNELIVFESNTDRVDLQGGLKLTRIVIKDKFSLSEKFSYQFVYSYFNGNYGGDYLNDGLCNYYANSFTNDNKFKRLKLDTLIQCNNTAKNEKYVFNYYEPNALPSKTSFAIDHWGYYNGQGNSSNLMSSNSQHTIVPNIMPLLLVNSTPIDNIPVDYFAFKGAVRGASKNYITKGMLKSIQYPTKGKTVFEYEPHEFSNYKYISAEDETSNNIIILGGASVYAFFPFPNFTYNSTESNFTLKHRLSVHFKGYTDFADGKFTIEAVDVPGGFNPLIYQYTTQTGSNGHVVEWDEYIWLEPGTYKLKCNVPPNNSANGQQYSTPTIAISGSVSYKDYNEVDFSNLNYIGGGVRIKSIINYDENNNIVLSKRFSYIDENGKTSGKLLVPLKNLNYQTKVYGTPPYKKENKNVYTLNATSYVSLSALPFGNNVGYSRVVIETYSSSGNNGKEILYFTNNEASVLFNKVPDFTNATNGNLTKRIVLNNTGDTVLAENYNYAILSGTETSEILNVYAEDLYVGPKDYCTDFANPLSYIGEYNIYQYPTRNYWSSLTRKEITHYFPSGKVKETVEYVYNPNNFCIQTNALSASMTNTKRITEFKYPSDYPSATNFTKSMRDANIINKPVEQYTIVNGNVTEGVLNTYKTGADLGLNDVTYRLETTTPLNSGQFSPSNYQGGFSINSYYKPEIIYDKYDKGNLLQYHKANDINVSYIWGYNNSYPIAEARNAAVNQIAYTSFEEGCPTGWTCSGGFLEHVGTNTGKKVLSASSWTLQSPTLPAGTYVVSFWAKGAISYSGATISINGGNTVNPDDNTGGYYQKTITLTASGKIILSGGYTSIDEVRIYPSVAMMKTYTYDPLIGMTSATDENGRTTYYEYDSFGRLQYIRNQDREIVQEYKYHYKE